MKLIPFYWIISKMCSIVFMLGRDAHMHAYQEIL
jgi:hypothetical protein